MMAAEIIERFASRPDDGTMSALIEYFEGEVEDADIVRLADVMARSGHCLEQQPLHADVASTGGPGSLSTLLCPLFLRSAGRTVPKLGVPGRPAGGIDTLASIPGFRAHLSHREVSSTLDECGYAHFLADQQWVPLDSLLFSYRQRAGAQALAPLVIASLLAKKVAAGISEFGVDIRVAPHGNFGTDFSTARENAKRLIRVAKGLQMVATCFLTDSALPSQPYIGRGEALMAIAALFEGSAPETLGLHADSCRNMVQRVCGVSDLVLLQQPFFDNLHSQGVSDEIFQRHLALTRSMPRVAIVAPGDGFLTIDLEALRSVLNRAQSIGTLGAEFADPTGITLKLSPGSAVIAGDQIAEVRIGTAEIDDLLPQLRASFQLSNEPLRPPTQSEVISA